jgi:hypothetical protein
MFTCMTRPWPHTLRRFVPLAGLALCAFCAHAQAPPPISGDVNEDGQIDVLDLQGATNIALGVAEAKPQADVDESDSINVIDLQVLTNTALGTGGLVQPVTGALTGAKGAKIAKAAGVMAVAVSSDGRKAEAAVDATTGGFELLLPVRASWGISFIRDGATLATVNYPLAGDSVASLPLLALSTGATLDLGDIDAEIGSPTSDDLRTLLAETSAPLDVEDRDADGLIDLFDALLLPYPWDVPGAGIKIPAGLDPADLEQELGDCIGDVLDDVSLPDLTGIEVGGVPAFAVPMLSCLTIELTTWLNSASPRPNPFEIIATVAKILDAVRPRIGPWLNSLDRDELTDLDNNSIPDYIEGELCLDTGGLRLASKGEGGECRLDDDGNGKIDFCEDADGDGIPNFLDPDSYTALDSDGDGITNDIDLDDDNDGDLDYADAQPLDPNEA